VPEEEEDAAHCMQTTAVPMRLAMRAGLSLAAWHPTALESHPANMTPRQASRKASRQGSAQGSRGGSHGGSRGGSPPRQHSNKFPLEEVREMPHRVEAEGCVVNRGAAARPG
jgi:hypothetical protein